MLEYKQKHLATRTWLSFNEDELSYKIRDNSGEVQFSVQYGSIPATTRLVFERNNWLRNVGLIWCVLGVIQIAAALGGSKGFTVPGFWLIVGLGCLAFYRATWSSFTVFDTQNGSIFILSDKQSDDILALIQERRSAQLLQWFKQTDYGDDVQARANAIEWLKEQNAISDEEAKSMIAEIKDPPLLTDETSPKQTTLH